MKHLYCFIAFIIVPFISLNAKALDDTQKEFANVATYLVVFDYLAQQCEQNSGFNSADSAKIEDWRKQNNVEQVRAYLTEFEQKPSNKKTIDNARQSVKSQFESSNIDSCQAAMQSIASPQAQFTRSAPHFMASLGQTKQSSAQQATPTPQIVRKNQVSQVKNPKSLKALAAQIDSFAFNARPKMGVGGFIMLDIYPVVLFKNGDLLDNIEGLNYNGNMADYKKSKPDDWSSWRKSLGKLQIKGEKGWENLEFQDTYKQLPNDFRLNGLFYSASGTGNVAFGGNQSVTVWDEYLFSNDGRVVKGGGSGSSAASGDISVVSKSVADNQRGKYHIDGLILMLNFDDGSSESHILVTDPKDPKSVIWLDGASYVRRKK